MNAISEQISQSFIIDVVRFSGAYIKGVHTQETWEVTYVATPGGSVTIGNHVRPFEGESLILIPPGVSHGWSFPHDTEVTAASMFFTSDTLKAIALALPETAEAMRAILAVPSPVIYNHAQSRQLGGLVAKSAVCNSIDRALLSLRILISISHITDCKKVGDILYKNTIERKTDMIVAFVRSNFQKKLSLTEVSAVLGFNKSALCTFVKKNLGMTYTELINKYRLKTARNLLETTELTVSQIAYEVGFSNGSYLNRLFKRKFGISPLAFRKQRLNSQSDNVEQELQASEQGLQSEL